MYGVIGRLEKHRTLDDEGLRELLESDDLALVEELHDSARRVADSVFGKEIYLRALIEWSNACRNDCLYCGIRRSNHGIRRYSLSRGAILSCCEVAWNAGLRTFVLQGGENPASSAAIADIVAEIRASWPQAAITLSLGELPAEDYALLRRSGADRYLLRHESADPALYASLHPREMKLEKRLECLRTLKSLGFQTGMGMMVGVPGQSTMHLIEDLRLIESFRPEMVGIGPFVPQKDTPLGHHPAGSADLTLRLYSIVRLMLPDALIPSTTALSTVMPGGRIAGIRAGANVIMPDFTPSDERKEYALYEGKNSARTESAGSMASLRKELAEAGYNISTARGDYHESYLN